MNLPKGESRKHTLHFDWLFTHFPTLIACDTSLAECEVPIRVHLGQGQKLPRHRD